MSLKMQAILLVEFNGVDQAEFPSVGQVPGCRHK